MARQTKPAPAKGKTTATERNIATLFPEIVNPRQRAFLTAYVETASVVRAAQAVGLNRHDHHYWQKTSKAYPAAWERAKAMACDALESEAIRRAMEGVEEPVFYQGEECGAIRRYSDTLLIFTLKGAMPEKYRERYDAKVDVTGDAELIAALAAGRARVAALQNGDTPIQR